MDAGETHAAAAGEAIAVGASCWERVRHQWRRPSQRRPQRRQRLRAVPRLQHHDVQHPRCRFRCHACWTTAQGPSAADVEHPCSPRKARPQAPLPIPRGCAWEDARSHGGVGVWWKPTGHAPRAWCDLRMTARRPVFAPLNCVGSELPRADSGSCWPTNAPACAWSAVLPSRTTGSVANV